MDNDVSPVDHFWCSDLHWISKHVIEFLEWVRGQTSSAPWWAREAQRDLDTCWECVLQYHLLVEGEVQSCSVKEKQRVFTFDRKRLERSLKDKLESLEKLSHVATRPMADFIDLSCDDEQEDIMQAYLSQDAAIVYSSVSIPLQEVLMYPQYLHCTEVSRVFVSLLSALIDSNSMLNVTEKMAGIYMLLVHSDQKVQKWAVEHVRALGTVTTEEFEDGIAEAVFWVLSVAQNGLLAGKDALPGASSAVKANKAILGSSNQSPVWDRSAQTVLPSHLFSSTHPKVYWLGMCMLLKALDGKLLQSEQFWQKAARCGHCTLADAVVQTIQSSHFDTNRQDCDSGSMSDDEDAGDPVPMHSVHLSAPSKSLPTQTAFWPALQCFITLVERLGASFWKYSSYTPVQIIQKIVSNRHYCREVADRLKCDAAGSTGHTGKFPAPSLTPSYDVSECAGEDNFTCSQMVYDWNTSAPSGRGVPEDDSVRSRKLKRKKRRGHDEVLQWCEPFVRSLVQHCDQQVLFESVSLLLSHLRGLYDSIVRASLRESPFQLSSHSALAAMSLAQLWKVVFILLLSKQFQLVKAIMHLEQGDASRPGATDTSIEKSTWLSLAAEVVIEAAASVHVHGSQFASPPFLSRQQTTSAPSVLPDCVPAACQVVTTLLGGVYNARSIAHAVNSLSAKSALPTPSPVGLFSAYGAVSPLVAMTPNRMLGGWGRSATSTPPLTFPSNPLATPSNPFAKESHHLRQISTMGKEELVALMKRSLEGKAIQDTHERFDPHLTSTNVRSRSARVGSCGGQGEHMAGWDQSEEEVKEAEEEEEEEMKEAEEEEEEEMKEAEEEEEEEMKEAEEEEEEEMKEAEEEEEEEMKEAEEEEEEEMKEEGAADAEMLDMADSDGSSLLFSDIDSDEGCIPAFVRKSPVAMVTSSKASGQLQAKQSLSQEKTLGRGGRFRQQATVLWSSDSDDDDFESSPSKDMKKTTSSKSSHTGTDLTAKVLHFSPGKVKTFCLFPPEEEQAVKKKARQCNFILRPSPVPAEKWISSGLASGKVSRRSVQTGRDVRGPVQTGRDMRGPAVIGSSVEEATTESLSEGVEHMHCSTGKQGKCKERLVKSKAIEQTGNVAHSLALGPMERRKRTFLTNQRSSSTLTLSETESDSDFDLPKVSTHNLISGKQTVVKATQCESLAQREDTGKEAKSMDITAALFSGIDKDSDDLSDYILSERELAEFDDFGATSDEDNGCKGKTSDHNVDCAHSSVQALEGQGAGQRTAHEKPAVVFPKARDSYQVLFSDEDDEECEQEDPLLPLPDVKNTFTASLPDAMGGQCGAQLVKGSRGIDTSSLVASYHSEEVAQKAEKATPTVFKHREAPNGSVSCHVTTHSDKEAATGLPPAVPSLVAPHASVTLGPSEPQGLGSTHAVGASHPTVDAQATSQMSGKVNSDASSPSVPIPQQKPEVAPASEPASVRTSFSILLPEGRTSNDASHSTALSSVQKAVTQSDSDSDMSSDDTSIAIDPLGGLLSDKLKLQKQQQVPTKTAQAPNLLAALLGDKVKHSPAVVKSAPFSKSRAPLFGGGNEIAAARVCRKQTSSVAAIPKPTSKSTNTNSAHGPKLLPPQVSSKLSSVRIDLTPRPAHSVDELLAMVLSWNVHLFLHPQQAADGRFIQPAPECGGIQTQALQHVPCSFTSVSQYFNVYAPLLMLEIWDSLSAEMRSSSNLPLPFTSTVESIFGDEGIIRQLRCHGCLTQQQVCEFAHPVERDLVVLTLSDGAANQIEGEESSSWKVFGIVAGMRQIRGGCRGTLRGPKDAKMEAEGVSSSAASNDAALSLIIKVHALAVPCIREGGSITVTTVTSFTTYQRQWCALINMHRLAVARQLLYPVGGRYFGVPAGASRPSRSGEGEKEKMERGVGNSGEVRSQYNWSQRAVIESAVSCACEPYTMPRMVLLQGPPGTGKTHTIVGLVKSFFESYHKRSITASVCPTPAFQDLSLKKLAQPHLLVCAPSNAGVDEIVRRLLAEGLVVDTHQWRQQQAQQSADVSKKVNANGSRQKGNPLCNGLKVIRVGRESKMHSMVLPLSLDTLARCKLAEEAKRLGQEQASLQDKMTKIAHDICYLEAEIQTARKADSKDISKLIEERRVLQKQQKDCQRQHSGLKTHQSSQRHQAIIRRKLLQNADIVCCTLASSGSKALEECFLGNPLHFTCTVIDEATQCCELDVLIPLRYGSSKVVLVGDPLQLPATIKSQQAKKFGYDLSLFERLYKYFKKEFAESPVKMLQVQYRMLPEICHFPALHFYEGKLQTQDKMQGQPRPPLRPCLLFDVQGGREESGEGSSLCNPTECSLVMEICRVLQKSIPEKEIGVITPYKAQEKLIRRKLNMPSIEVGTVDGFQGREKDAIILSCVRAKAITGSIGFLSDGRRMNVALTRAKFGLYIVCHKSSLEVSPDWSALIAHAEERKWVVEVTPHMNAAITAKRIEQPPSAVHTVQGRSVELISRHHGGTSSSSRFHDREERQQSSSSHAEQEAKVDRVPPTSSGNQLLHCTSSSDSLVTDVRKRRNSSHSALEAKRLKPADSDSDKPQVQGGNAAATGRRDIRQLDCTRATVQSEGKTTPLWKPQSRPGLLPTPPIGVKPGNLSNLGFNAGPKRRVAHQQGSSQWRSNHVPNLHSQYPHSGKPSRKVAGQQRKLDRRKLQKKLCK